MNRFLYLIFFPCLMVNVACNNSSAPTSDSENKQIIEEPENLAYNTNGEFEPGTFNDTIYTNSFFGFEIKVPETWNVLAVNNVSRKLKEQDSTKSTEIDPSEENYYQLLSLQQNGRIPLVNFMVEKTEPIPGVTNAKEYLEYTEDFILTENATGYPHYIGHAIVESLIGNRPFLNQTFTVEFEHVTQFQRNYSVQFDNYIFTIITHYGSQGDLDQVEELLQSIIWN